MKSEGGLYQALKMTRSSVAERTFKYVPLAMISVAAVVWGVSKLRTDPITDCDKHKETGREIDIQRSRMKGSDVTP